MLKPWRSCCATNELADAEPLMRRALSILEMTPTSPNLAAAGANHAYMMSLLVGVHGLPVRKVER